MALMEMETTPDIEQPKLTVLDGGKNEQTPETDEAQRINDLLREKLPHLMDPLSIGQPEDDPTAARIRDAIEEHRTDFLAAAARAYFGREESTLEDVNGADHLTASFIYALKKIGVVVDK